MEEEYDLAEIEKALAEKNQGFAGAKVTATTPRKRIGNNPNVDTVSDASQVDKLTAWVDEDPTGSMQPSRPNVSLTDTEIEALPKPDATIDIVRDTTEYDVSDLDNALAMRKEEVSKEEIENSLWAKFNSLISDDSSYERWLKVQYKIKNTKEQYLSTTVNNPLTATGSAMLATGAGLLKVGEDLTGLDLHAKRATRMVQRINEDLSADVKFAGDITASLMAGAGIVAPSLQLGAQTLGEGKGYTEAAGVTAASLLVGTAGKLVIDKLIANPSLTSNTTKLMLELNQGRISEKEFAKMMEGVPEADRVLVFAESQKLFKGHIKDTIKDDSTLRAAYGKRLEARRDIAMSFTANEKQMGVAASEYSKMRDLVDSELPDLYAPANVKQAIENLGKIYASDPSSVGTAVRQIMADLGDNISVGTALDIRQNINSILRKPSVKNSYNARTSIQEIKDSLDSFIALNINKPRAEGLPPYQQVIDDAINSYRQTKNDYLLGKLIEKNTKNDYAVDWAGLNKDIKKAGLHSDNVDLAIPVLKALEDRFVNDKALSSSIVSTGAGEGTGALGLWSKAVKVVLDFTSPVFNQARHTDLRIQRDILKSIQNPNNDYLGFIDDMLNNKSLPLEVKQALKATVEVEQQRLLEAPANFTARADGTVVKGSGDEARAALNKEPINTTVIDETNVPSTNVKPQEEIIDVETWTPTSTVITPDGHVITMEDLLRAESLPDNMKIPEKLDSGIRNFFDMKLKLKTDPDLIKAREEVKKAKTPEAKGKAKDRLASQLEYQRLRDQGMKPAEAHKLSIRSSGEAGGALAGGTMNGVEIDDNGNLTVDPEKFLIGMAAGAAVVKGGKSLGKLLSDSKEVYYHGTNASFTKFDASQNPQGLVWFTNSKDYAKTAGSNIHTVKLNVKSTFDFTNPSNIKALRDTGLVTEEEIADVTTKGYAHKEQPFIVNILKSLGFDSMYTEVEKGRKSIAIFDADNQVVYKEQTK